MKRTAVLICFFLFSFRVYAQTSCANAQVCADAAQAAADAAQASAAAADATYQDTVNTYNNDVASGASSAQQTDDHNVMEAAQAAAGAANDAAYNASQDALVAQADANNGNEAGADAAAANAASQEVTAAVAAAEAVIIDANANDTYGDPSNWIWTDNPDNDTSVEADAVDSEISADAAQALASDPSMIAAEQQAENDMTNLFNSTIPPVNVAQGDPDDSC